MGEERIVLTEEEHLTLVSHRARLAHIGAIISNLENEDLKFFGMCQVDMRLLNGLGEMVEDSAKKIEKCLDNGQERGGTEVGRSEQEPTISVEDQERLDEILAEA